MRWQEYDQIEPIGGVRGDWQAASICSTLMNVAAAKGRSKKRFLTSDFLLHWTSKPREKPEEVVAAPTQTWQEQKMIAMMFYYASQGRRKK